MPKKYRFRKVYFICIDKQVIKPPDRVETFYKFRADAEAEANNQLASYRPYQINNPSYKLPNIGAQGFFLVHESLYEEILKAFDRVELNSLAFISLNFGISYLDNLTNATGFGYNTQVVTSNKLILINGANVVLEQVLQALSKL